MLASLSQKHLSSKFRTDHTVADFAVISEPKQKGKKRGMFLTRSLFQKISLALTQLYNWQMVSQLLCEDFIFLQFLLSSIFKVVYMKKIVGLRTSASFCNLKFIFGLHPHAFKQTNPLMSSVHTEAVSSFLSLSHCLLAPTLKVAKSLRCSYSLGADS